MFDFGKSGHADTELLPYLQSVGYGPDAVIDHGIISHRDEDHYGGLAAMLNNGYRFTTLTDNGSSKKYPAGSKARELDDANTIQTATPGQQLDLGDGAYALVVAVGGKMIDGYDNRPSSENDKSIVLLVKYGDFEFISGGDLGGGNTDKSCTGRTTKQANIESSVCKALHNKGLVGNNGYEVMHVNHHGSESSTNAHYMNTISPKVAIISTGEDQKDYQHPRKNVVESVLLGGSRCVTVDPALVLQTDELDDLSNKNKTSTAGYAVGDIVITTTGSSDFTVSANGQVVGNPSEVEASGLPMTILLD